MNILVATGSYGNDITALEACLLITEGAKRVYPRNKYTLFPLSEGGKGTLDSLMTAAGGGEYIMLDTVDPFARPLKAKYGILSDGCAVIEAQEAGRVNDEDKKRILDASSYGIGILIKDALKRGLRNIYLCLSDASVPDGGWGMAKALGVRFLDRNGSLLPDGGGSLVNLERIDDSFMSSTLRNTKFRLLSNERIVLSSASQRYATGEDAQILEKSFSRYSEVLRRDFSFDTESVPGSGNAGGLACPLLSLASAETRLSTDFLFRYGGFERIVASSDIVITGEETVDSRTAGETLSYEVIKRAQSHRHYKDIIVIAGELREGYEKLYSVNVEAVVSAIDNISGDKKTALKNASERIFRIIRMARNLEIGKVSKTRGKGKRKAGMKKSEEKNDKPLYSPRAHVPGLEDHAKRKRGRPRKTAR